MGRRSRLVVSLGIAGALGVVGAWVDVWSEALAFGWPVSSVITDLPYVAAMIAPYVMLASYRSVGGRNDPKPDSPQPRRTQAWMIVTGVLMVGLCLPFYVSFAMSKHSTAGMLAFEGMILSWLLLAIGTAATRAADRRLVERSEASRPSA